MAVSHFFQRRRGAIDERYASVATETARICRLAEAHHQCRAGNPEILDGSGKCEGVGRDDANVCIHVDETLFIECLWVDDCRIDIGEYLEFARAPYVVAIAR